MVYFMFLMMVCLVLGLMGVASNPSPYYAALGLVMAAGMGCGLLVGHGGSFLSLVLFLIYLGGMLVVFAYTAALAAEPYPESWGNWSVLLYVGFYLVMLFFVGNYFMVEWFELDWSGVEELSNMEMTRGDFVGVALLYEDGGWLLVLSGWVLLLTLFVVLELTRGLAWGTLRVV
ncbi:NADH dehydrogenase subunit 6 (mitochondrion) [Carcharodon carcharias]|uniref:NADH-ubiquinone oxidoreductase chain 6 n=1 Tax=Carcharodon carcharias TaxID=13397 RepID=T1RV54_CARCH|nr:NADH dehydrogenase subunit 6 [Carcharodon carcharias]AGO90043.1 NADH dehydrogenase subunit 6 [Carcharodon carcharias]APQ47859.1 NADH dehydrogenase subunit 6 [Carcharodon carcharias]ARM57625.1 NADH dehydrogenase subunit 6 [Carcharodon carcharias]ARM57638.1 NADH dehydrogenase subunit 6 [Carcharodon carcharias]ARM57651.1 NADH dehydrogenase subunit 6 [Carcharodon carcharias]